MNKFEGMTIKEALCSRPVLKTPDLEELFGRSSRTLNRWQDGKLYENPMPKPFSECRGAGNNYKSQVWLENFNDVFAYKAKNKTFPPAGYNGGKLSMWLRHQNKIFNTLSEEKRVKLLSIGFDKYIQESKIKVDKWQESYNAAFSYKKNHGKLPLFSENKTIYNWVNRQKNRMSNLKPDQVKKMLSLLY